MLRQIPTQIKDNSFFMVDEVSGLSFDMTIHVIEDGCPRCRATGMVHEYEDLVQDIPSVQHEGCCTYDELKEVVRVKCPDCNSGIKEGAGPLMLFEVLYSGGVNVSPYIRHLK